MTSPNQDTAPFCILNQTSSENKACGLIRKISMSEETLLFLNLLSFLLHQKNPNLWEN